MSGKQYQEMERADRYHTGKMKKRHLKNLRSDELTQITDACLKQMRSHQDVAGQYGISSSLVGRIVRRSKNGGSLISDKRQREELSERKIQCIQQSVTNMLKHNTPIWNSAIIKERLQNDHGLEMQTAEICRMMRKVMKFGHRKASQVPI